jgi:arsenite-transporting ATPase
VRALLFAGKGGVGKTTVAAAAAVAASRCGIKTLVLSTDPAPSLTDALQVPFRAARGVPHEVQAGLSVLQVDAQTQLGHAWATVQRYVVRVLEALGGEAVEAADLLAMTGADDLLALLCLRDQLEQGPWDLVVVDAAATGETLRLLSVPDTLVRIIDRLWSPQRRLALRGRVPTPESPVTEAMARLLDAATGVQAVLRAPTTSVRLVLTPERVVLAEARRAFTSLCLQGYPVDGVVANRVVPIDGADPWRSSWAAAQHRVLAEADDSFAPIPVQRLPYLAEEPVGVDALAALGAGVLGPPDEHIGAGPSVTGLLATPPSRHHLRVSRSGGDYDLSLPAPFVSAADVELSRDGDELRLRVQGTRRVVALPPVLRRCVATSAQVANGRVVVRFTPDPDAWPTRGTDSAPEAWS